MPVKSPDETNDQVDNRANDQVDNKPPENRSESPFKPLDLLMHGRTIGSSTDAFKLQLPDRDTLAGTTTYRLPGLSIENSQADSVDAKPLKAHGFREEAVTEQPQFIGDKARPSEKAGKDFFRELEKTDPVTAKELKERTAELASAAKAPLTKTATIPERERFIESLEKLGESLDYVRPPGMRSKIAVELIDGALKKEGLTDYKAVALPDKRGVRLGICKVNEKIGDKSLSFDVPVKDWHDKRPPAFATLETKTRAGRVETEVRPSRAETVMATLPERSRIALEAAAKETGKALETFLDKKTGGANVKEKLVKLHDAINRAGIRGDDKDEVLKSVLASGLKSGRHEITTADDSISVSRKKPVNGDWRAVLDTKKASASVGEKFGDVWLAPSTIAKIKDSTSVLSKASKSYLEAKDSDARYAAFDKTASAIKELHKKMDDAGIVDLDKRKEVLRATMDGKSTWIRMRGDTMSVEKTDSKDGSRRLKVDARTGSVSEEIKAETRRDIAWMDPDTHAVLYRASKAAGTAMKPILEGKGSPKDEELSLKRLEKVAEAARKVDPVYRAAATKVMLERALESTDFGVTDVKRKGEGFSLSIGKDRDKPLMTVSIAPTGPVEMSILKKSRR
jgi:hypothetical protein